MARDMHSLELASSVVFAVAVASVALSIEAVSDVVLVFTAGANSTVASALCSVIMPFTSKEKLRCTFGTPRPNECRKFILSAADLFIIS